MRLSYNLNTESRRHGGFLCDVVAFPAGLLSVSFFKRKPLCLCASVFCLCLSLCLSSCDRRELTYCIESEITVTADWSSAGQDEEDEYGATLIFYPQGGGAPHIVPMGERTNTTVRLPEGRYDVVLFNRSFDDFGAIAFRGQDKFETLEAYARQVEATADTHVIVSSPEKLATAMIRDFEVTEDMLGNYAPATVRAAATCPEGACTLHFTPRPLTRKAQAELNVRGLHNVRQARCTLSGVPQSVFLWNGRPGERTGEQEFIVSNPVFNEGSLTDGTLTGTLNIFGLDTEIPHDMTLSVLLVDNQTVIEQELIDVNIRKEEAEGDVYIMYVEAFMPQPLPDVKPEGGSDSGFDTSVEDWGDEKTEKLPI